MDVDCGRREGGEYDRKVGCDVGKGGIWGIRIVGRGNWEGELRDGDGYEVGDCVFGKVRLWEVGKRIWRGEGEEVGFGVGEEIRMGDGGRNGNGKGVFEGEWYDGGVGGK